MAANNGTIALSDIDDSTVIVSSVTNRKKKKSLKEKRKRINKEVSLHLFDKEYIEKLYLLEISKADIEKSYYETFKNVIVNAAKVLMK